MTNPRYGLKQEDADLRIVFCFILSEIVGWYWFLPVHDLQLLHTIYFQELETVLQCLYILMQKREGCENSKAAVNARERRSRVHTATSEFSQPL